MKQYGDPTTSLPPKSLKHCREASPKERNCKQLTLAIDKGILKAPNVSVKSYEGSFVVLVDGPNPTEMPDVTVVDVLRKPTRYRCQRI